MKIGQFYLHCLTGVTLWVGLCCAEEGERTACPDGAVYSCHREINDDAGDIQSNQTTRAMVEDNCRSWQQADECLKELTCNGMELTAALADVDKLGYVCADVDAYFANRYCIYSEMGHGSAPCPGSFTCEGLNEQISCTRKLVQEKCGPATADWFQDYQVAGMKPMADMQGCQLSGATSLTMKLLTFLLLLLGQLTI